jgi:hypothetical protein
MGGVLFIGYDFETWYKRSNHFNPVQDSGSAYLSGHNSYLREGEKE